MKSGNPNGPGLGNPSLRKRAEELLRLEKLVTPQLPTVDVQAIIHELQVHQIELEIQNEELRQAQIALANSRDCYVDLYEFAPVGYVTIDHSGFIREANLAFAAMLGVERREVVGKRFGSFMTAAFQDAWHLYWQQALESESKQCCDLELSLQNGALAARIEGVAGGSEEDRCLRAAVLDISVQKENEMVFSKLQLTSDRLAAGHTAELGRALEKLRLMSHAVANLSEGVLISEGRLEAPGPRILFVNRALCEITGYRKEEILGRTPRMFQGEATDRLTLDRLKVELSAGRPASAELVNYGKEGEIYHTEIFVSPVFDEAGKRTHFISIQRDVTRRKELEEEVINASENERLSIAYDLHDDLGSLLTGIKLGIESLAAMLKQDEPVRSGQAREIASQVSEAMVKTRTIAAGLRPVGSEPDDLMDALVGLARRMQEASGIEVRFLCPRPVLIAEQVMANHLFRIAQEAVSNAVKHSGGSLIIISLQRVGGGIDLMVEDNGCGMGPVEPDHGGLGLIAMSYRAGALRGSLRITTGGDGGVKVACSIPSPEYRP
jgi:PAS domain S-box-containing protein